MMSTPPSCTRHCVILSLTILALFPPPVSNSDDAVLNQSSREFLPPPPPSSTTHTVGWNELATGCSSHCSVAHDADIGCWQSTLAYFEKVLTGTLRQYIVAQV